MTSAIAVEQNFGRLTMDLLADFQRRLDEDLAARNIPGISRRYRAVLIHLGQSGRARNVELARAAGIRPQSMMKIVHELEQQGLVRRTTDPDDSRAKQITFTHKGQDLIRELAQSTESVWSTYVNILGAERLRELFASVDKIVSSQET